MYIDTLGLILLAATALVVAGLLTKLRRTK